MTPRLLKLMNSHFNSIKVRLKPIYQKLLPMPLLTFQFHKGTIETSAHDLFYVDEATFQFHKGTIETT